MLCLGYGITPRYFQNKSKYGTRNTIANPTLRDQLFGSQNIANKIGHLEMISSIDTTFDLLSIDAFVNFNIRRNMFNDGKFTHFIPLYLHKKHGQKAMKQMDKFVLQIWNIDHDTHSIDTIKQQYEWQ